MLSIFWEEEDKNVRIFFNSVQFFLQCRDRSATLIFRSLFLCFNIIINFLNMQSNKAKVSIDFKKKLRQEYERLKKLQEKTQKEVVEQTWVENR